MQNEKAVHNEAKSAGFWVFIKGEKKYHASMGLGHMWLQLRP